MCVDQKEALLIIPPDLGMQRPEHTLHVPFDEVGIMGGHKGYFGILFHLPFQDFEAVAKGPSRRNALKGLDDFFAFCDLGSDQRREILEGKVVDLVESEKGHGFIQGQPRHSLRILPDRPVFARA